MNVEVAANKRFLDTTSSRSAVDWDELLMSQVDLSIASELEMLLGTQEWNRAAEVVDAGCGNGYYISRLQSFFPEKSFVGVDISPEMTANASLRFPHMHFKTADFFHAAPPPADALIMRFLVQHLGDFAAVLKQARRSLRPDGALIIIESDLARSELRPVPVAFYEMLTKYHAVSAAEGGLKGRLLGDVDALIDSTGENWRLSHEVEKATALVGPFNGGELLKVFGIWVDLAERSQMFAIDFAAVRDELADWGVEPASFVKLVTRMFVLQPVAA